ncbi:MAG: RHS repeat-associated core domain-containing protein, partial [Limisphaerales bacterium]
TNAAGTSVEQIVTLNYDYQGHVLSTLYADGYAVTNWFNALGQLAATCDSWGCQWRGYSYNNLGLLTRITNGLSAVERSVVYDIENQPIYVTDANGVTVTNSYDALGRLQTRTYPDSGVERFGYSARGLIAYTNQLNFVTRYVYDEASRKTYETNANLEIIRYTNNAAGDLLSLTDGKNQTTKWNYDFYGRVTNKIDQASAEILRYKYDADNRLTNRWSAAKANTYYSYDNVGNLTFVDYTSSPDLTFAYDALNRLTNMVDAVGATKYTYTAGNQLLTEDGPFASDTMTNGYNNRLRTSLSLQQPSGVWNNSFAYDAAKRLTNITSPAGSFGYNYAGQASRLTSLLSLPNTAYITDTYDNLARLTGTYLDDSSGSILNSHEYVHNVGNQRTDQFFNDGDEVLYDYDPIGQLTQADATFGWWVYGYDKAWNVTNRTGSLPGQWSVDNKNQLTDFWGGSPITYDDNGNLTFHGYNYWFYGYDDENQLTFVELPGEWRTDFIYDGMGRLRQRTESQYGGGDPMTDWQVMAVTEYIYDGRRVIQERDINNTPQVSYTRGNDLSGSIEGAGGIGGLLARSEYASATWTNHACYHADGNGNITYMINPNQSMVASYRYDPFGNTISKTGTLADANVYRFSSKEFHNNSGMYYYGYRFYDPNLQRWINADPIGVNGGLNLYQYIGNDPVSRGDPLGLQMLILVEVPPILVEVPPVLLPKPVIPPTLPPILPPVAPPIQIPIPIPPAMPLPLPVLPPIPPRPPKATCPPPKTEECKFSHEDPPSGPFSPSKTCWYDCPLNGLIPLYVPQGQKCEASINQPVPGQNK